MLTALLTGLAGTAVGAALGMWTRRTLDTLNYRLDDEQDLPTPGQRWWIIWASAISLGSITAWITGTNSWPLAPVLLPLTLAAPALAGIDLDVMRLPNRVLGPVALVVAAGLASTIVTQGGVATAIRGIGAGLVLGGTLWTLNAVSRGGVGFGDVKLAALTGATAGAISVATAWWSLLIGSLAAFVRMRATSRDGALAFGPSMLLGLWIALLGSVWSE